LRRRILLAIAEHEKTGTNRLLDDTEIAAALDVSVADVKQQLAILESEGLVELVKTFGQFSAQLTAKGMLAVERWSAPPDEPKRPLAFSAEVWILSARS
jgi:Mn-dependent DtxR family transcriptional regulator